MKKLIALAAVALLAAGCADLRAAWHRYVATELAPDSGSTEPAPVNSGGGALPPPAPADPGNQGDPVPPEPPDAGAARDDIDPATIAWDDADASAWRITATITEAHIARMPSDTTRGRIGIAYEPRRLPWPSVKGSDGRAGWGNVWVGQRVDGRWRIATVEWLPTDGRTVFEAPWQWSSSERADEEGYMHGGMARAKRPRHGETIIVMLSTYARGRARTSNERSQIKALVVP